VCAQPSSGLHDFGYLGVYASDTCFLLLVFSKSIIHMGVMKMRAIGHFYRSRIDYQ
jgi:hypothetical protein